MEAATSTPQTVPGEPGSRPAWQRIAGIVGAVFLGAIFLVAAYAKTLDPAAFAKQITLEGLDFLLPAMAVALIALALEVFLGGALLLAVRRWWILVPTSALVAFFLFLTGRAYWRHSQGIAPEDDAGCGCFGNLVERTPAEAFWQDLALMVPALLLAWLAFDRGGARPRLRLAAVAVLTAATMLVAWKAPELPLDNLATRLKPGVEPLSICAGLAENGSRVCMDAVVPELAEGEHVVIMAELESEALGEHVGALNEYHWGGSGPSLWVLTSATEEQVFNFRFTRGPSFELREAPAALLRPLYRTLPRSFLVRDGRVVETYRGLPPLEELAASQPAADEAAKAG